MQIVEEDCSDINEFGCKVTIFGLTDVISKPYHLKSGWKSQKSIPTFCKNFFYVNHFILTLFSQFRFLKKWLLKCWILLKIDIFLRQHLSFHERQLTINTIRFFGTLTKQTLFTPQRSNVGQIYKVYILRSQHDFQNWSLDQGVFTENDKKFQKRQTYKTFFLHNNSSPSGKSPEIRWWITGKSSPGK